MSGQPLPAAQDLMNDLADLLNSEAVVSDVALQSIKRRAQHLIDTNVTPELSYVVLGMIAAHRYRYKELIDSYEQALTLSSHQVIYQNYLSSLLRAGKLVEFLHVSERYIDVYKTSEDAKDEYALGNLLTGNTSTAVNIYRELVDKSDNGDAFANKLKMAELVHQINVENKVDESKTIEAVSFALNFLDKKGFRVIRFTPHPQHDEFDSWVTYRFIVEPSEKLKGLNFEFSKESTRHFIEDDSAFNGIVISFEPADVSNA